MLVQCMLSELYVYERRAVVGHELPKRSAELARVDHLIHRIQPEILHCAAEGKGGTCSLHIWTTTTQPMNTH
jgi:hypothetical protein